MKEPKSRMKEMKPIRLPIHPCCPKQSSDLYKRAKSSEQHNRGTNTGVLFSPNFIQVQKGKAHYYVHNQGETTLKTRKNSEKNSWRKSHQCTHQKVLPKSQWETKSKVESVNNLDTRKNSNKKRSSINLGHTTGKPPSIRELQKTQIVENLRTFFMNEYIEKGEDGLPVKMGNDSEVTDDE